MYLDMIATIPGIEFNERIPDDNEKYFLGVSERSLVVLDDLMAKSGTDNRISGLFTKGSRRNLSVIYFVLNIFHQGRESRNISFNAHYILLFKSFRDKPQISVLARQVIPAPILRDESTRGANNWAILIKLMKLQQREQTRRSRGLSRSSSM